MALADPNSFTLPTNEGAFKFDDAPEGSILGMRLRGNPLRIRTNYTFTVTLNVPANEQGQDFKFVPEVNIDGSLGTTSGVSGTSAVTIKEPLLDGKVRGSGGVTYSVDSPADWTISSDQANGVTYMGAPQVP